MPSDGGELAPIFLSAVVIGVWTHSHYAAPAVIALVQFAILAPLAPDAFQSDFSQIMQVLTAWFGSVAGAVVVNALDVPRFIHRERAQCGPSTVNIGLLLLAAAAPWLFVAARSFMAPPWPGVQAIAAAAIVWGLAWAVWTREFMFNYFTSHRHTSAFVSVIFALYVFVFAAFTGLDFAFGHEASTRTVLARIILIVICTAATAVVNVSPCRREKDVFRTSVPLTSTQWPFGAPSKSASSSSDEDEEDPHKTAERYVEYTTPP